MAVVTLSFDNGPDPETTPRVLDVLARRQVPSTFFVIGRKLADPEARCHAERAAAEGHWIGNHSFTHTVPLGQLTDPESPDREIGATQRELGNLAHQERWFRPFGGGGHLDDRLLSPAARDYLLAGGYSCVTWNVVPGDWKNPDGWMEAALAGCWDRDWSLVVLHDYVGPAMRHLDRFLGRLVDAGHRFVQEFPPDCVPISRGRITGSLDGLVAGA